jgi:heat shock protein HtpX
MIAVVIIKMPASPMQKAIRLVPAIVVPLFLIKTWWNDDLAISIAKARPARRGEFPYYVNCVESLAIGAGIPCPAIYVIDDPAPNAFSSGRDPAHARICVTTGLLKMMNRVELEGVIAHEFSHIRSYDTMLMTIVLAGVRILYSFTGVSSAGKTPNIAASLRRPGVWIAAGIFVFILTALGFAISIKMGLQLLAVCAGMALFVFILVLLRVVGLYIIPAAFSREREFLADAHAGLLTRLPIGLIQALTKMKASKLQLRHGRDELASILMVSSGDSIGNGVGSMVLKKVFPKRLYALNPSVEERIQRLEQIQSSKTE